MSLNITLAQLNYTIGDIKGNSRKIIDSIEKAKTDNSDLVVFSELSLCGYPPFDLLNFDTFINDCRDSLNEIAEHCVGIAAIVGAPTNNYSSKGKRLYNSACFLYEGTIREVRHKTLLADYDVFDEYRYFEPNDFFKVINYKGYNIALTICEDLWNVSNHPLYKINPLDQYATQPDFIINIAASPFHDQQQTLRRNTLAENAKKYKLPIFYCNQTGAQTDLIFDGCSMVMNPTGDLIYELPPFEESLKTFNLDEVIYEHFFHPTIENDEIVLIYKAIITGIRDYFAKLGLKKAILGLSGGIDSALTLVLAAEALGKENVFSLMMPSRFSSDHSIKDSQLLLDNLGCKGELISIESVFNEINTIMQPYFLNLKVDTTEENIQARIRAVYLMAFANKFGYILLNTSNKSEAAVGYGTLYGDMCGGLSVLGDVYKTRVYQLAKYINRNREIIPENIIKKPPSAELRYDQKDSDSLPDYETLDSILYQFIEKEKSLKQIVNMGYSYDLVKKVINLVVANEWKRFQTPPILRISSKAFGSGRIMPIVASYKNLGK